MKHLLATLFAFSLGAIQRPFNTDRPIVIVDDSSDDLRLIQGLLAKVAGLEEMITYTDAELAIQQLTAFADSGPASLPLCLILDVRLPGLTGLELLEWVREHASFDAVPIVILTSSEDPAHLARAAQLGAQCYLGKYPPVLAVQQLVAEIDRYRTQPDRSRPFAVTGNRLPEPSPR